MQDDIKQNVHALFNGHPVNRKSVLNILATFYVNYYGICVAFNFDLGFAIST